MILDAFKLDGRVALVTGGARGMGAAMSLALAEAGADVVIVDIESCMETCGAIKELGRRSHTITANLLHLLPDTASALIEECVETLGRFDILVNNAGINRRSPALVMTSIEWSDVLSLDLSSVFYLSQAAGRHFVNSGQPGKIINIASMLSFQGGIDVPAYAAAKSGVLGLTRALANEWARYSVNVNAIAPGWIATEFTTALRDDPDRFHQIQSRIPAGRWGDASDVRGVTVFLASEASSYVHGAVIPVDGGWLAW